MSPGERIGAAVAGLIGLVVLSRQGQAPGRPPLAPVPPGTGYAGDLFATDPEPMAPVAHDTWELSPDAERAVMDAGSIAYVGGGPWDRARCATSMTPHALDLGALIRSTFAWVRTIGGLRCEALHTWHGDELSIHGAGRALDVMTPVPPLVYGSPQGEQLANWCVVNAAALGIQLVIWNRMSWQGSLRPDSRFAAYTRGTTTTSEHRDHVHIEVTS